MYQRQSKKAPQYDISSERDDRLSDNSDDEEWEPDEVTRTRPQLATCPSTANLSQQTVSEVGTEKSQLTEVLGQPAVNPDDWPNIDLKPSNGSVKGQRYVGPEGEKIDNLGDLTVKVRTKRHGGGDFSSRMTFQGAMVRKPLLAVSGVIDNGNIVVFDTSGSFTLPNTCAGVASVRMAITGVQGCIPLHAKNGWTLRLANVGI